MCFMSRWIMIAAIWSAAPYCWNVGTEREWKFSCVIIVWWLGQIEYLREHRSDFRLCCRTADRERSRCLGAFRNSSQKIGLSRIRIFQYQSSTYPFHFLSRPLRLRDRNWWQVPCFKHTSNRWIKQFQVRRAIQWIVIHIESDTHWGKELCSPKKVRTDSILWINYAHSLASWTRWSCWDSQKTKPLYTLRANSHDEQAWWIKAWSRQEKTENWMMICKPSIVGDTRMKSLDQHDTRNACSLSDSRALDNVRNWNSWQISFDVWNNFL